MNQREINVPTDTSVTQDDSRPRGYWIRGWTQSRLKSVLANPTLTPEQIEELFTSAATAAFTLWVGTAAETNFTQEFIELSDSLMGLGKPRE